MAQTLFDRMGAGRGGGGGRGGDPNAAAELKAMYTQALEDLTRAGVTMTPVEYDEGSLPMRFLLEAEGAAAFDDITRDGEVRTLKGQAAGDWPNTFRSSRLVPAVEYIRAQRARTLVVEKFESFMADWDVVVIPTNSFLTTTNLTGNPQVVMKCGFTGGLPRSISFLGKIYDEGSPSTGGHGLRAGHGLAQEEPHADSLMIHHIQFFYYYACVSFARRDDSDHHSKQGVEAMYYNSSVSSQAATIFLWGRLRNLRPIGNRPAPSSSQRSQADGSSFAACRYAGQVVNRLLTCGRLVIGLSRPVYAALNQNRGPA